MDNNDIVLPAPLAIALSTALGSTLWLFWDESSFDNYGSWLIMSLTIVLCIIYICKK